MKNSQNQKIYLTVLLNRFKQQRKKLRLIRYPLATINWLLPENFPYLSTIKLIRLFLRLIKYYLYFMICFLFIYLKLLDKN